jgi:uncharacterized membrane protein YgdD (TMEM256/DUF423 family)
LVRRPLGGVAAVLGWATLDLAASFRTVFDTM